MRGILIWGALGAWGAVQLHLPNLASQLTWLARRRSLMQVRHPGSEVEPKVKARLYIFVYAVIVDRSLEKRFNQV